jgi:hypothetical protein
VRVVRAGAARLRARLAQRRHLGADGLGGVCGAGAAAARKGAGGVDGRAVHSCEGAGGGRRVSAAPWMGARQVPAAGEQQGRQQGRVSPGRAAHASMRPVPCTSHAAAGGPHLR